MLERILVPLDGSTLAESTLPHAINLAATFGSQVHLLTVTEPPPLAGEIDSAVWRMARAEAGGYLDRVARRLRAREVDVRVHVLDGNAAARTLDCARENRVDLVLLSRHARGGLTPFPMSGTAFKIVSGAPGSVLLAPPGPPPGGDGAYVRVLAPVDCSRRSDWSAHLAAAIARGSGAELVLATVVPTPEVLGEAVGWSEHTRLARQLTALNRATAESHLQGLAGTLGADDLRVRTRVVEEPHVARALAGLAREEGASLVVVAAHGRTSDCGWSYGSVASRLLDQASQPLVVFQDLRSPRSRGGPVAGRRASRETLHA